MSKVEKPTVEDLLEVLNMHFDNLEFRVPEFRLVLDKTVSTLIEVVREEEREFNIKRFNNALEEVKIIKYKSFFEKVVKAYLSTKEHNQ